MSATCPLCELGELESRTVIEEIRYRETVLTVRDVELSVCPKCGAELALPPQAKNNERRFADAKRAHDGLLTSREIVAWRKRHGLTQQKAAALVGGGVNAFSKYERGEVVQSQAVDTLMRSVDQVHGMLAYLSERSGIQAPGISRHQHPSSNVISLITRQVTRTLIAANDVGSWDFDSELELVANG